MNASILPRLRLFGAVSVLVFAASAALAQTEPEAQPAAPASNAAEGGGSGGAAKAGDKPKSDGKKTATPAKRSGQSGYASEAEARARCKGGVVWIDKDRFNHYPGSREYGKKPGAFACEQG